MTLNYKVVEGSQSLHCCFEYSVVDTTRPVMIGKGQWKDHFEPVCECFDLESANLICDCLNHECYE